MTMNNDEIFTIKARRCKRCGGLLTSKQAVEDGYGHVCKIKIVKEEEARKLDEMQVNIFDILQKNEE